MGLVHLVIADPPRVRALNGLGYDDEPPTWAANRSWVNGSLVGPNQAQYSKRVEAIPVSFFLCFLAATPPLFSSDDDGITTVGRRQIQQKAMIKLNRFR